jgi:hypothetical protein
VFGQGQNVSTRPGGVVGRRSDFGACEAWFAAYPSIVLGNPTATVAILHVRMELPFTVSPFTGFPATVKPHLITLAASAFGAAELTIAQLTYTSGMQSADFGGAQTELSFVVYQISAQVGRGFPGERTVEILP